MNRSVLFFGILAVALTVGCNRNVQVTGKVQFADETPLRVGSVVFESESDQFSANGKIQEDGTYKLGSVKEGDGIPRGTYRVSIIGAVTYGAAPEMPTDPYASRGSVSPFPPSISLIHRKYASAETSELSCNVTQSTTYDITVEKP